MTHNTTSFHLLSANLIGKIASYLHEHEYRDFKRVNRTIMNSTSNPITLHYLNLSKFDFLYNRYRHYASINLRRCPLLHRLRLPFNIFLKLRMQRSFEHIEIDCAGHETDPHQTFISQNLFTFDNVKTLQIRDFIGSNGTFWEILKHFPKLQYLYLASPEILNFISDEQIQKLFANLKGFGFLYDTQSNSYRNQIRLSSTFINLYGNNLEFLELSHAENIVIPSNVSLSKLKHLQIWGVCEATVNSIFETAKKLRKVNVCDFNIATLKNIIVSTICNQPLLEYIGIDTGWDNECYQAAFDGIEYGLYKTKNIDRKFMKVEIRFSRLHYIEEEEIHDIILRISRVINILLKLHSERLENFMFICRFGSNLEWATEIVNVFCDFIEYELDSIDVYIFGDVGNKTYGFIDFWERGYIVITNKNCEYPRGGYCEPLIFHE